MFSLQREVGALASGRPANDEKWADENDERKITLLEPIGLSVKVSQDSPLCKDSPCPQS